MFALTDTSFKALDNLRPAQRHRIMDAVAQCFYKGTAPVNLTPVDYALFVVILENVKYAQKHGELEDFKAPAKIDIPSTKLNAGKKKDERKDAAQATTTDTQAKESAEAQTVAPAVESEVPAETQQPAEAKDDVTQSRKPLEPKEKERVIWHPEQFPQATIVNRRDETFEFTQRLDTLLFQRQRMNLL